MKRLSALLVAVVLLVVAVLGGLQLLENDRGASVETVEEEPDLSCLQELSDSTPDPACVLAAIDFVVHKGGYSTDDWKAIDEIVWSIDSDGAYIDDEEFVDDISDSNWYALDIPVRYVKDSSDPAVNIVFLFGEKRHWCSAFTYACVSRIGGIYETDASCGIAMPDEELFDEQTTSFGTKGSVHFTEVVWHELGHCLGLVHEVGGIMGKLDTSQELLRIGTWEQAIAQAVLDALQARAAA